MSRRLIQNALLRAIDVGLAAIGLVLVTPIILILAVAVRATSPGPGLFVQTRVGRREQPFLCYKLRTMSEGTVSAGTHEVSGAAVTPLGRVLRRVKLDELPQLWNVLRGDMSLVGPRPGLPVQQALLEARRSRNVFVVRPGVTGPSQVAGVDMSEPERLAELDASYSDAPNLPDYLRYLVLTVAGRGQGDRVRHG